MTVVMCDKPSKILKLVRGHSYERPRGDQSLRSDASNYNIKEKQENGVHQIAELWQEIEKEYSKTDEPSMQEIVMGLFKYHELDMESKFKDLKEQKPEIFHFYNNQMEKAFFFLLDCLSIGDKIN